MIKAVIFDMDGVLIDSEPVYMQEVIDFIQYDLQAEIDYRLLKKRLNKLVGSPNQKTYDIISECLDYKYSSQELKSMMEKRDEKFEFDYKTILNPHVLNILPRLKNDHIKLAVASSSPLKNILEVLDDCEIKDYFDSIISGLDFKESKPNPAIYFATLDRLGVNADEAIAIEDSTYGIEACHNANVRVIAKFDNRFDFDQSKANYMASDLLDVTGA